MDDGLKQRLVGALVLVAIGVLFIPALFEPDNRRQIDTTPRVPAAPDIESIVIKEPVRNKTIEAPKPAGEMYRLVPEPKDQPAPAKASTKDKTPVVLDSKGVPEGWVVQVASYGSPEAAKPFLNKLRKANYPAFSKTLTTSKGRVTRIYVGPKISKQTATDLKRELDKKYGLTTLLARFKP